MTTEEHTETHVETHGYVVVHTATEVDADADEQEIKEALRDAAQRQTHLDIERTEIVVTYDGE